MNMKRIQLWLVNSYNYALCNCRMSFMFETTYDLGTRRVRVTMLRISPRLLYIPLYRSWAQTVKLVPLTPEPWLTRKKSRSCATPDCARLHSTGKTFRVIVAFFVNSGLSDPSFEAFPVNNSYKTSYYNIFV